jgi:hypothetical protein
MDIWNGVLDLSNQKDGENWPWKNDDTLALYYDNEKGVTNNKIARILSKSLENKFRKSLFETEKDAKSGTEDHYIRVAEDWISTHLKDSSIMSSLQWDDLRDTAPYAVIFVLFMCGQHSAALKYCKEFCSKGLYDLYQLYYQNKCQGLHKSQIRPHFQEAIHGDDSDEYKQLLAHIMVGNKYKDDSKFLSNVLFNDNDIATWYFLKLAGFQIL